MSKARKFVARDACLWYLRRKLNEWKASEKGIGTRTPVPINENMCFRHSELGHGKIPPPELDGTKRRFSYMGLAPGLIARMRWWYRRDSHRKLILCLEVFIAPCWDQALRGLDFIFHAFDFHTIWQRYVQFWHFRFSFVGHGWSREVRYL